VPESDTNAPFEITDIILSTNQKTLLVYYSPITNMSQVSLKTFRATDHNNNFENYEDKVMMINKNLKNITLDNKG
jgi:hypothetical protein